jgi:two-component system, OmpR family, phosphate regulon response regulator PhoB
VSTGQEALDVCREEKPDLILMDIFMPGDFSGIETTRLLKGDSKTHDSKVIMLTSSTGTKQEALNARTDDYLVKPFSPLELLRKIDGFFDENLLSNHSEHTESI